MKRYKRKPNRSQTRIKADIHKSSKITREDVAQLIKDCVDRQEAEDAVRLFFEGVDKNTASFRRYGKEVAIERIVSDLDSYKDWDATS